MAAPRFEIIDEQDISEIRPQPRPSQTTGQDAAFSAMMLALKTMSQKTVIALSRLESLAMVGSVFWLFMSIPNPSNTQIIWGGIYASFILVLTFFRMRR